jgi:hypothetical protein
MTRAATIISDALAEIGVIGANDVAEPEHAEFCLRKLNQILERWSNTRLAFPVARHISIALTGAQSYTLGPATSTVRPIRIDRAHCVDSAGVRHDVDVITRADWDSIAVRDQFGGPPERVWYDAADTNATVNIYPRASGYTLNLECLTKLASFANTASTLTLPEGYALALTLSLATEVAAAFGTTATADTRRSLAASMAGLYATNAEPAYLQVGHTGREYRIERGY